ncbi:sulfotransferase family protein [Fodinicurvata sediminis]|uniref:sulfotransferase family protein n=1 Tax=Fodinicurvata sediminis TaxID=1121832 RepID=UPI0003B5700E|nr:sulfotransferase family protein [Fodinicurvata sediminis]
MTDLILHIGLPKTATTTLQRHILPNFPAYLGTHYGEAGPDFAQGLLKRAPVAPLESTEDPAAADWARQLLDHKDERFPDASCIVISHESLTNRQTYGPDDLWPVESASAAESGEGARPFPIISFLETFSEKVWQRGDVKVLLTLRNQPDWLASLYAQKSAHIKRASQRDFEDRVRRLIRNGNAYLDWSAWVHHLRQAIGADNLCVLPMEEMDRPAFWQDLADFLGLDRLPEETPAAFNRQQENARRTQSDSWAIRPLKTWNVSLKRHLKRAYERRDETPPRLVRKVAALADSAVSAPYLKFHERQREMEIRLPDDLRSTIQDYCRPFNQRLAEQLGRDLSHLGY